MWFEDCSRNQTARIRPTARLGLAAAALAWLPMIAIADSVNSPNVTINVDTNRSVGPGAGNVAVVVNTITVAEVTLPEFSSGDGRAIRLAVRPGYQLDPASPVTATSATIGFNGGAIGAAAALTPAGTPDEALTFNLTSGTSTVEQDIIRITGVRLKISSAAGAAGPAQTLMSITTTGAGGSFTNQGIVAANINRGAADRIEFATQPGATQSGAPLLPAVRIVDFGGNTVTNDNRAITLALQSNPGAAVLQGITQQSTQAGIATWEASDDMRIAPAAAGYTLRATHSGAPFLSSDAVVSTAFDITAGPPNGLDFSLEPVSTVAGGALLVRVTVLDQAQNVVTSPSVEITLDSAVNPGGWPLLADSSLTKSTSNGVAEWFEIDNLRINSAIAEYRLRASGVGAPIDSATFAITAGAPSNLRFVQQPTDAAENATIIPPVTVEVTDAFGNRAPAAAEINLALQSPCAGTLSGGLASSVNGLAVFSAIGIDTPCPAVTLAAAAGGLTGTSSEPFTVTGLPPTALRFVQQPTDALAGEPLNPPVSLEIVDAAGKRTASTATVQLALLSSCGGVLSLTSAQAVGGLATFAILSADTPCSSATLQATSSGLTGTTSQSFDIIDPSANPVLAACGACGQGGALAALPLLLSLVGMKFYSVRRRRRA